MSALVGASKIGLEESAVVSVVPLRCGRIYSVSFCFGRLMHTYCTSTFQARTVKVEKMLDRRFAKADHAASYF